MNKEEDVELLETTSIDASINTQSEMKTHTENMATSLASPIDSEISEDSSLISPFSKNSTAVSASVNSPRIAPESTFAATTHGMKQQDVPNIVPRSELGKMKQENLFSNPPKVPNSNSANAVVNGTNANSPRIAPESTFAATVHGMKQQTISSMVSKQELDDNKMSEVKKANSASNSPKESNTSTKPILLIVAFLLLLGTIFFLPYSKDLFDKLFSNNKGEDIVDNITHGDLVCTMESDDDGNSYQYTETYSFHDSEVDSLNHRVLIQGDADYLKQRNNQCLLLKQNATSISGVTVNCSLSNEEMVETQSFNLASFDLENVTTPFIEAGGVYPNASKGDDYKEVQRMMEISGYDCKVR